jgi:thiosulfate/3-mercaptopyruvate sulfurtransferase
LNRFIHLCTLLTLLAVPLTVCSQGPTPITAQQLLGWLAEPDPPLILDLRGRQRYRSGTLPGAFDAGTDPKGYLPDHSGDPVVLLTARQPDPRWLGSWVARLANAGHPVRLLSGGLEAWSAAGGEVEIPHTGYAQPGRVPFLIPKGLCEGGEPVQVFE